MTENNLFGGIEAGGTKFVCAVGSGPETILDEIRFPTTTPAQTVQQVCNFFAPHLHHPMLLNRMDEYILPPALGNRSGVLGAIALAMDSDQ